MARKIITAFFTHLSQPKTGLTPTIDIWELDPTNPAVNTLVVNDGSVTEIGGGWYRYDFLTYDYDKDYTMTIDGGAAGLTPQERYKIASNDSFQEDISHETWNATATDFIGAGTMGLLQNQTAADAASIKIDVTSALSLITTLLKYETNRTRIDKVAKTLTVYDDDGTSILKVFDLKDSNGLASVTEVCERSPTP